MNDQYRSSAASIFSVMARVKPVSKYELMSSGKMTIRLDGGRILLVSREQVENILLDETLDAKRREMYEGALAEFQKAEKSPSAHWVGGE